MLIVLRSNIILDLKNQISNKISRDINKIKLYYRTISNPNLGDINYKNGTIGQVLDDNKTLIEHDICKESFFDMHVRLF